MYRDDRDRVEKLCDEADDELDEMKRNYAQLEHKYNEAISQQNSSKI